MSAETQLERLKFKRQVRMDMIDTYERHIERYKSWRRTIKDQVKELNRQIGAEYQKATVSARTQMAI